MLLTFVPVLPQGGIQSVEAAEVKLHKPKRSNGKITYDCVWFGSYPQAEVVTTDLLEKYESSYNGLFLHGEGRFVSDTLYQTYGRMQIGDTEGDFIVDPTLYQTLQSAKGWDANGIITLADGERYCRIKRSDVVVDYGSCIDWENDTTYHYFKYQPIKWRVLSVKNGEAFLVAQNGLDCCEYIDANLDEMRRNGEAQFTWSKSVMRKWLNSYDHVTKKGEIDNTKKGFIDTAFNQAEKKAIKVKEIENKKYDIDYRGSSKYFYVKGYEKEKPTKDRVFLLSFDEITNKAYGFSAFYMRDDHAKEFLQTAYAQAMGSYCWTENWVLRSLERGGARTLWISSYGDMYDTDIGRDMGNKVVPALYLNISASDVWSYAGTVSVEEIKNGLVKENGKYYYYKDNRKKTRYTGLIRNQTSKGLEMCYVKKGVWQSKYTGMVKHAGKWQYVKKGKKSSTTGLVKHKDGSWWYVKKGKWQSKYTGIVKQPSGKRYYVEQGKKKYVTGDVTVKGKIYKLENGEVIQDV